MGLIGDQGTDKASRDFPVLPKHDVKFQLKNVPKVEGKWKTPFT